MQPIQLVSATNPSLIRWMCAKCEHVGPDREDVARCCTSMFCIECNKRMSSRGRFCRECQKGDRAALHKSLFGKANKVYYHEYDVPYIYWEPEGHPGKFFRNKTQIEDWCVELSIPTPTWVWGCKATPVRFSVSSLLPEDKQHLVSEEALEALQSYLDTWVAANELNTYECDYDTAVVIDSTLMSEFRAVPLPVDDDAAQ